MRIIGIDPGVDNGIALYKQSKLIQLETMNSFSMYEYLSFLDPYVIVIEDSRLTSHVFTGKDDKKLTQAAKLKIARNIGMVDRVCHDVEIFAANECTELIKISPLAKGVKLNAADFETVTGWTDSSNQHERDAAMVAYLFRHKYPR